MLDANFDLALINVSTRIITSSESFILRRWTMIDIANIMPILGDFASPAGVNLHPGFIHGESGSSNLENHANARATGFLRFQ
jgi:hypothetical protein